MALDAGTPVPEEYLAGELTQAEGACPQRDCYVYRVKGRKLELIEALKPK